MNIVVEKQPKCTASASIEIPADIVRSERQKIVNAFNAKARIPGFRPGKTPLAIIEKRFRKEISEELLSQLTDQAYKHCQEQHADLAILDVSAAEAPAIQPDGSAKLDLTLVLFPEFKLPDYKGIKVSIPPATVSESVIDNQIDDMRERMASFEAIQDRSVQAGDVTRINFTATIQGEPISKATSIGGDYLDSREDYWLKIEEDSFLPGVAMQLVGMNPGDSRTVTVTMPEDHPIESLRNQTIDFAVTVVEAGTMQLPEINDEFAAKILPGKTIAELRDFIREISQSRHDSLIKDIKSEKITDAIVSQLDFDLPETLLHQETQRLTDLSIQQLAKQGLGDEQILERREQLVTDAAKQAEKNLRINFVLQAIGEAENIKVSQQEILSQVVSAAESRNIPAKKLLRDVIRNRQVDGIHSRVMFAKIIDFLIEQSEFEETSEESATEAES